MRWPAKHAGFHRHAPGATLKNEKLPFFCVRVWYCWPLSHTDSPERFGATTLPVMRNPCVAGVLLATASLAAVAQSSAAATTTCATKECMDRCRPPATCTKAAQGQAAIDGRGGSRYQDETLWKSGDNFDMLSFPFLDLCDCHAKG